MNYQPRLRLYHECPLSGLSGIYALLDTVVGTLASRETSCDGRLGGESNYTDVISET